MRDVGIPFKPEMVRAILRGHKSVTRRIVRPGVACRYRPGQTLWVRETWAPMPGHEDTLTLPEYEGGRNPQHICYRADERTAAESSDGVGTTFGVRRWRPSILMPRWASRIDLYALTVRAERLHAIDAEDVVREGVRPAAVPGVGSDASFVREYARLWDTMHGKTSPWASDPEVWRIEFERRRKA